MLTALHVPLRAPLDPTPVRCMMPLNDDASLKETQLCGKPATTHRTSADLVWGLCESCAASLDKEILDTAKDDHDLSVVFNSKSIGSADDLGAYFDPLMGQWTAPRYEIRQSHLDDSRPDHYIVHLRTITREEAIDWLAKFINHDAAAN